MMMDDPLLPNPNSKNRGDIGRRKVRAYENKQSARHSAIVRREQEVEPEIRQSLEALQDFDDLKQEGSGKWVLRINSEDKLKAGLRYFASAAAVLQRSGHSLTVQQRQKGHRTQITGVTCEVGNYIHLCDNYHITVPQKIKQLATAATPSLG